MKPHLVIKTRVPLPQSAPHWRDFIHGKEDCVSRLEPSFDALMASENAPFWLTTEYQQASPGAWSASESAAGLDRIYRVILRRDSGLAAWVVDRLRLNPLFESVQALQVGIVRLPYASLAETRTALHGSTALWSDAPYRSNSTRRADTARASDTALASNVARGRVDLATAHLITRGEPSVRIAVLDTGVDRDHPELWSSLVGSADFVNVNGLDTSTCLGGFRDIALDPHAALAHGTHVAGIIAGQGLAMPVGVAPACQLLAVRVLATLRDRGEPIAAGLVDNINTGIKWAVDNGADVINMSLGLRYDAAGSPHAEVIHYALSQGVTIVAASGSDGTAAKYYPAALPGVFAVGAADDSGSPMDFTSFGSEILVTAPGVNILSAYSAGHYAFCSGTSQAAPFVSGAAALLKSLGRALNAPVDNRLIRAILAHSADLSPQRSSREGFGCLNLADACRLLKYVIEGRGSIAAA